MQVVADIAVDREPAELVAMFVAQLDGILQEEKLGRVTFHRSDDPLWVHVRLTVSGAAGFNRILQFFAEADAPIGTTTYQVGWFGRKKNICVLGP